MEVKVFYLLKKEDKLYNKGFNVYDKKKKRYYKQAIIISKEPHIEQAISKDCFLQGSDRVYDKIPKLIVFGENKGVRFEEKNKGNFNRASLTVIGEKRDFLYSAIAQGNKLMITLRELPKSKIKEGTYPKAFNGLQKEQGLLF